MARISRNVMGALGIGIITLIYLYEAFQLPFGSAGAPDMGFVPVLMGIALLVLCIMLIGKELLLPAKSVGQEVDLWDEEGEGESTGFKKPLIIIVALLIYPIILVNLGFILSTIILLFIALRVMEYRSWLISLLVALVTTVLANIIFSSWLSIYFPKGILG
ncbi:Protein of unknown function DUF1468 [Moorella glycerini]|uniref:Tripartite tricarboxylate transporter TctB family protein n=1 Tax=Neomoorella stamsii TaxID=1266720 RepID=A0A9X7J6H7_9FIRM|nr:MULTISPECIES: tripartite tricarboxylate transporter TctB family protein [Moorella]PRR77564.1 Tripartite tricarboxylate transporter TctB family protein [Moorella stamsii]CEP69389.1 Protein of unknown function DUF1468 [Moorella glycerini]